MSNFSRLLAKFCSGKQGSVAMIVGVMLLLIIGILVMTIDLGRVQSGKTNNQSAVDASVLGAAEYITRYRITNNITDTSNPSNLPLDPNDISDYARNILKQNLAGDQSDAKLTDFKIAIDGDANHTTITTEDGRTLTPEKDQVIIYACVTVKTSIAATLGDGDTQKACNVAKANLPGLRNVEVVFALDSSQSMADTDANGQSKLQALQKAVNALMTKYQNNNTIYWGVVPYTGLVDLGPFSANIVEDDLATGQKSPLLNLNYLSKENIPANAAMSTPAISKKLITGDELDPAGHLVTPTEEPNGPFVQELHEGALTLSELVNMHYNYDAYEDTVMDNYGRPYREPQCNNSPLGTPGAPPNNNLSNNCTDFQLHSLIRTPLTSRAGNNNPENASTISFDDNPPGNCPAGVSNCTPGPKFQAYWHQPYDFFLSFNQHEHEYDTYFQDDEAPAQGATTCGACYDDTAGAAPPDVTVVDTNNQPTGQQCGNPIDSLPPPPSHGSN